MTDATTSVRLPAGPVEYRDTGGTGPVVVLLHGLMTDGSLWDGVVADLGSRYRCVVPTLPLGAHRRPMAPDADLSLSGIAALVLDFLARLDLRDVTLVGNDTGGALAQIAVARDSTRIARLVLASCDAFDNFPPGLTGRTLVRSGRLPAPLFGAFMQQMRLRAVRRSPLAFGWLTKRGDAAVRRSMAPVLRDPAIRRDTVRLLRAVAGEAPAVAAASQALTTFDKPALVLWASEDRVMPVPHGRRLAELLPQGRLTHIADSYTLLPFDQPVATARVIRSFIDETTSAGVRSPRRGS